MSTWPLEPDILFALLPAEPQLQPELAALGQMVAQAPNRHLIVDFSRVEIVTSPSIGSLLLLRKNLSQQERRFILCNVCMATRCILRVAGLDSLFEFATDKADAQRRCRTAGPKTVPQ